MSSVEKISSAQGMSILVMFLLGTSLIFSGSIVAKQDSWISIAIAIIAILPIYLIYARIIKLYPQTSFFDILTTLFGNVLGKIFIGFFIVYALYLASLVIRNFTDFMGVASLPETPAYFTAIAMGFVCMFVVKNGVEVYGKAALLTLPILLFFIFGNTILSIKDMDINNLLPIGQTGIAKIAEGGFDMLAFPLGEAVLLLEILSTVNKKGSPYKILLIGGIIGGITILIGSLRNIMLLGGELVFSLNYPSYLSVSILNISTFFTRFEVLVSSTFLLAGLAKASACMIVCSRGFSKILNIDNYRQIAFPVGLICIVLSLVIYTNDMETLEYIVYYNYFAMFFQILIPVIIWITAEIKSRQKGNKKLEAA